MQPLFKERRHWKCVNKAGIVGHIQEDMLPFHRLEYKLH